MVIDYIGRLPSTLRRMAEDFSRSWLWREISNAKKLKVVTGQADIRPTTAPAIARSVDDIADTISRDSLQRLLSGDERFLDAVYNDTPPSDRFRGMTMADHKICAHCDHVSTTALRDGGTRYTCTRSLRAVTDGIDLVTGQTVVEFNIDCYDARTTGACGQDGIYFVPGKPKPR